MIVQTMSPKEPAIVMASRHDYEGFAAGELATRVASGLPPASRMARVVTKPCQPEVGRPAMSAIHCALRIVAAQVARLEVTVKPSGPSAAPAVQWLRC